jgi:hypothetical protein
MFFTEKVWGGVPILDTSSLSSGSTTAYTEIVLVFLQIF